jgi:hypothetical protein
MNSTDFAYAAGYIDGDGCFQIGNQRWGSHLVIVSVRKEPINWFMDHFEGSCRAIHPRTSNRFISYHFRFSEKGLESLKNIYPYLVEKRQECEIFSEYRNSFGESLKSPLAEKMNMLKNCFGLIQNNIKEELTAIRNTISPTIEDFAYLAGYIDAECSLDINRRMQPKGKTFTYRPQLQCNNTKYPFFYWASARFGGQFHFLDKSHIPNCRNQIIWRISNVQLDSILEGVCPFLTSKKPICEMMKELRKLTFKGTGRMSPNHPNFSEWYKAISVSRESIYEKVRHFNNSI